MRNRPDEFRTIRAIDDLASTSPKRMFALSPNDVLVQISLPLVLILAIVTRLMIIGQTMAAQERGPMILEMWKQQLIMRMERVLSDWETTAQLPAFPEFSRIQWQDALPNDERFKSLCVTALALDEQPALREELYHRALRYPPTQEGVELDESASYLLELYDPQAPFQPEHPERIPPEFIITPERRAYALDYISDRVLQWNRQVENLQWAVVAECAARLPFEAGADETRVAAQMRHMASVLSDGGYPLLRSVKEEFSKQP